MNSPAFSKKNLAFETLTFSAEETRQLGESVGKLLKRGDFLVLSGDLGSGKTTFVKGIVKSRCSKFEAKSPSFIIVNEYEGDDSVKIYHLDFYRVKEAALDDIGFAEFGESGIVIIEWGEKVSDYLPGNTLVVRFEFMDENENGRKISFYGDEIWQKRLEKLNSK